MQTTLAQYLLDLCQRLLSEIAELHQVLLLIRNQLAKAVDLGSLQTVERTHRKIEIFQRGLQYLAKLKSLLVNQVFLLLFLIVKSDVLIRDDHQMLDQDARSLFNSLFRVDRTIRRDLHDQLLEVCTLFHTRILDGIFHILDRRKYRVGRNIAKWRIFRLVVFRRDIAAALTDRDLDIQL